jgi:hypothetical protein
MSQENVEIIRRGYAHFMATGEVRVRADLVWDVSRLGWPDQQIYAGAEGANQFNGEWADSWDDWEMEAEDYLDAGERVSLKCGRSGTDRGSGWRCMRAWRKPSKLSGCGSSPLALPALRLALV